jgi:membrane protein involved in colicin uptake
MADAQVLIVVEVNEEERVLLAALKAVQEKKARILEEAEAKRKAEEERKAEEKRKAEEAEAQRLEAAEKEKAAQAQAKKEEAEKIWVANEAMKVGVAAHLAEVKRMADDTAVAHKKAQALATRQKNLAKIGVRPDDPLMLVPEGPGPSREEVRNIRQQVAGQGRKRKLGDTGASVRVFPKFSVSDKLTYLFLGRLHILCTSGPGIRARNRKGLHVMQCQEGPVLLPRSKAIGRDYCLVL